MFNDLNNPANQNHQAVDDIFAETDKTHENTSGMAPAAARPAGNSEIDTQRIGLASTDEISENASSGKGSDRIFKLVIILIVIIVLGLGGYLVYSKFLNAPAAVETAAPIVKKDASSPTTPEANVPATTGSFVEATGGTVITSPTSSSVTEIPLIPGVNAPAATTTAETAITAKDLLIDSDGDGLADTVEKTAGTNINIIDTDNDGLSDYEEVNIYRSNPLSADTDADGYMDGAEVKSGYDPNAVGRKLSDATSTPKIIPLVK